MDYAKAARTVIHLHARGKPEEAAKIVARLKVSRIRKSLALRFGKAVADATAKPPAHSLDTAFQGPSGKWFKEVDVGGKIHVVPAPDPTKQQAAPQAREPAAEKTAGEGGGSAAPASPEAKARATVADVGARLKDGQEVSPDDVKAFGAGLAHVSDDEKAKLKEIVGGKNAAVDAALGSGGSSPLTAQPPKDLDQAKLGAHLHPNVQIRHTPEGDWVVKGRNGKLAGVQNESLVSNLAADIGLNVPRVYAVKMHGQDAAAVPHIKGATAISSMSPEQQKEALAKVPKTDLDENALFDYLVANADPNAGNYLIDSSGKFLAIDKEVTLGHGGEGDKATFYPPWFLANAPGSEQGPGNYAFDPKSVSDMAAKGDEIVKKLTAAGKTRDAQGVQRRVAVLKSLAENGQPITAAVLNEAGKVYDKTTPAKRGFVGRLKSWLGG